MNARRQCDFNRTFCVLTAAVAAVSVARVGRAQMYQYFQTPNSPNTYSATNAVTSTNTFFPNDYYYGLDIASPAAGSPSWGIVQFSSSALNLPNNVQVQTVASDLQLTLYDDGYSSAKNMPLYFFLTNDNTTPFTSLSDQLPGTVTIPSGSVPAGATGIASGLNSPGQTGSFASGSNLYFLGSAVFNGANNDEGADVEGNYNLTLSTAAENTIKTDINNGGGIRIVIATDSGYSNGTGDGPNEAEFDGNAPAAPGLNNPQLQLDLQTQAITASNTSTLYVGTPGTKNSTINIGELINIGSTASPVMEYAVYRGGTATVPVTLGNGSSKAGDSLTYKVEPSGLDASAVGTDPIAPGGTTTATVGFTSSDTDLTALNITGTAISGSVQYVNSSNANDTPVTINASSNAIEGRFLDAGGTGETTNPPATNVGKVLVGKTGTVQTTLMTTNSDLGGSQNYTPQYMTTLTLKANAQATAFTQDDPLSGAPAAMLNAVAPDYDQVFDAQTGTTDANGNLVTGAVTGMVTPIISGVYGDDHTAPNATKTITYGGDYADFENAATGPETVVVGEGLPGETNGDDDARVYLQWQGYQAASVTGARTGNTVTLTNAATNDNIYTGTLTTAPVNSGLRAAAWVTSAAFNQDGWSQSGLTPSTDGSGTVISGSEMPGDPNSYTASTTLSYNPTLALAGTYSGGSLIVGLENEQDIQGATANDLPAVQTTLASEVGTGTGGGTYNLGGGTFTALPITNLSGSFTQTGGSATFGQLNVTGKVTLTTGSTSVTGLSTNGSGKVDLTTHSLTISYTGLSPEASIRSQLLSGSTGGPGIITSYGQAHSAYGVGYEDSSVDSGTSLPADTLLLKTTLIGDANLDGAVNLTDLLALLNNYGLTGKDWAAGDFNYDGTVNLTDLLALLNNYGESSTVSGARVVPEPMSLSLVMLGGMGLLGRRRRRA